MRQDILEYLLEHKGQYVSGQKISELFGNDVAEEVVIQYGGSVKSTNAKELFEMSDIDGALIGGASLKVDEFSKIVNYNENKE